MRYGLMKRLKRGVRITCVLTYRCNLKCSYCVNDLAGIPKYKEKSVAEWKAFIENFPYRLREVLLSGGEPELYEGFTELVTWLLGKGLFVQVYTNLTLPDMIEKLPKSRRLMFIATYHKSYSLDKFNANYKRIKKNYRVEVDEIGERKLSYSRVKPFSSIEQMKNDYLMLRVGPDFKISTNCYDLYR